ncbi:glutamate racemase [Methylobacillus flagellatus]|uniref:glutamate racemase n=1 Tax=Methylobacillus flagellatus TaxID=405 RepID=UPI0010F51BC5
MQFATLGATGELPTVTDTARSTAPIGVFDSGLGGLSVLQHIRSLLPHEDLIFVADCDQAPYGNKSADAIQQRAFALSRFLLEQGAKALVVACNTATAAAISNMRAHFELPIIGMEPAVKPAVAASRSGVVGVLATTGTLQSAQFAALLESYGQEVEVVTQACNGLVECIERGELDTAETRALLEIYMRPLLNAGADTLVLGCTHYPFVRPLIESLSSPDIAIIDTGAAVARQLQRKLAEHELLNPSSLAGNNHFWLNRGTVASFAETSALIARLWSAPAIVLTLPDAYTHIHQHRS